MQIRSYMPQIQFGQAQKQVRFGQDEYYGWDVSAQVGDDWRFTGSEVTSLSGVELPAGVEASAQIGRCSDGMVTVRAHKGGKTLERQLPVNGDAWDSIMARNYAESLGRQVAGLVTVEPSGPITSRQNAADLQDAMLLADGFAPEVVAQHRVLVANA